VVLWIVVESGDQVYHKRRVDEARKVEKAMEQSSRQNQKGQPFRKQRAAERRTYEAEEFVKARDGTSSWSAADARQQKQLVLDWLELGGHRDGCDPPKTVLQFLADHGVKKLAQKKTKVPWALWCCHLCDHHLKDVAKAIDHLETQRHNLQMKSHAVDVTLRQLPMPSADHLAGVQKMLELVEKEEGLSCTALEDRLVIAKDVEELLAPHIRGCSVRVFGSSLSGFGLCSTTLDLDVEVVTDLTPQLVLRCALNLLRQSPAYTSAVENFNAPAPTLRFNASPKAGKSQEWVSCIPCELSLGNGSALRTGELLRKLSGLDRRVKTLATGVKFWAKQAGVEELESLPHHAMIILLIYFLQLQEVLPFCPVPEGGQKWSSSNSDSSAQLWVNFFKWLALEIRDEGVITLRREKTNFKGKRLVVEDPFSARRNLCAKLSLPSLDFLNFSFKASYLYFGTIQTVVGPVLEKILPPTERPGEEKDKEPAASLDSWIASHSTNLTLQEYAQVTELVPRNMVNYDMVKACQGGPAPLLKCPTCNAEGHKQKECPEEQLPARLHLPPLDTHYLIQLDKACKAVVKDWSPRSSELRNREDFVAALDKHLKLFWPEVELALFGSSANGFSFRQADLDISLAFSGNSSGSNVDSAKMVEKVAVKLRKMAGVIKAVAITSAKVPIVKMVHSGFKLEADISLYNRLAQENSRMLALYASVDERARQLGYLVKLFAKTVGIGDASRGSLSSYAYLLMMIFYLQQVEPPVLPVLQKFGLEEGSPAPEHIVDGWNAWFFSDRHHLMSEWNRRKQKNSTSVAELWLGFLDFYSSTWDDMAMVVSIRQKQLLPKFEKLWSTQCLAIEDPFDLSHNLGTGLTRRMWLYIKKSFLKAREHFGVEPVPLPSCVRQLQEHLFEPELLVEEAPPQALNCYQCGQVGHFKANCPRRAGLGLVVQGLRKVGRGRTRSMAEEEGVFLGKDDVEKVTNDKEPILKNVLKVVDNQYELEELGLPIETSAGIASVSPVLKAVGSLVSLSTCPGTNLNLPLVPSRSQGAMDLQDLERELWREPEPSLTATAVGRSMAYNTQYSHHDVNQNLGPAPVWQGRPPHRTSSIDQYPGPQYQQYATVGYQQSPEFSCQSSLACHVLVPGRTFQPPQGNRLQSLPMLNRANHLPHGSPVAGTHRQPSCQQQQAPFLPVSSQERWLP